VFEVWEGRLVGGRGLVVLSTLASGERIDPSHSDCKNRPACFLVMCSKEWEG